MLRLVPSAIRRYGAVILMAAAALSPASYVASQVRVPVVPPTVTMPPITPITPNLNPGVRLPVTPTLTPGLTPTLTPNSGFSAPNVTPGGAQGTSAPSYTPDENSSQVQDSLDRLVRARFAHLPAIEKTHRTNR